MINNTSKKITWFRKKTRFVSWTTTYNNFISRS